MSLHTERPAFTLTRRSAAFLAAGALLLGAGAAVLSRDPGAASPPGYRTVADATGHPWQCVDAGSFAGHPTLDCIGQQTLSSRSEDGQVRAFLIVGEGGAERVTFRITRRGDTPDSGVDLVTGERSGGGR